MTIHKKIIITFLILLFALVMAIVIPPKNTLQQDQQINVIFRYDDFSNTETTNFETKLIDIFQKYQIPCAVGIIPYVSDPASKNRLIPLNQEKILLFKNAVATGIVEPALHGYLHEKFQDSNTEFADKSYSNQLAEIQAGKKLLENLFNITIQTFIPPWNSYDQNTIKALEQLNFKSISAGLNNKKIFQTDSILKYIPFTAHINELNAALDYARNSNEPQPSIILLIHPFDFYEIDNKQGKITLSDFDVLLSGLMKQNDLRISSFNQILSGNNFTFRQHQFNHLAYKLATLLPPKILTQIGFYSPFVYYSQNYNLLIFKILFLLAGYCLFLIIISASLSYYGCKFFLKRDNRLRYIFMYILLFILFSYLLYLTYNHRISYVGFSGLTFLIGIILGTASYYKKSMKKKNIRVLFITMSNGKYGAGKAMLDLIDGLGSLEIKCHVVVSTDGPIVSILKTKKIKYYIIPFKNWMYTDNVTFKLILRCVWNFFMTLFIVSKMIIWKIDIVHTNNSITPVGALAAFLARRPHIWHIREFAFEHYKQHYLLGDDFTFKLIGKSSYQVIVISQALKRKYLPFMSEEKIKVIYDAVVFNDQLIESPRQYPVNASLPEIAIFGLLSESKGQSDAILAVAELVKQGVKVKLKIIGDSPIGFDKHLKKIIQQYKIDEYIEFVGFVDDIAAIYQSVDMALVCSRWEGFGRVTIEAMHYKKPVIGAKSGATPELIQEGINGLLYQPGNYHELAEKIKYLLWHPAVAKQMGENGFQIASEKYTNNKICAEKVLEIYLGAI